MIEEWRTINGHPKYMVSNFGRVMTIKTSRILKQKNSRGRYMLVGLPIGDRKYKWASIHRLVAEAFVDGFDGTLYVDHIDKNSFNNRADNLRCVTPSQNSSNRAPSEKTIRGIISLYREGLSPTEIRTALDWVQ